MGQGEGALRYDMVLARVALLRGRVRRYRVCGTRYWGILIGIGEVLGHALGRAPRLVPEVVIHLENWPIVHLGHRDL